jgi:hypothetical protein
MISLKQIARSIVISGATIAAIAPSTHAGSIPSGMYGTEFPYHGNIVEVKNTKNGQIFTTTGADYQTSKLSPSEAKFKLIRSGVIQHVNSKTYLCFVDGSLDKKLRGKSSYYCSRNGWKRG